MSEFTRWQKLNEALGCPLGVTSPAGMGLLGISLGEGKKKMDDIPVEKDDIADDADVEDSDDDEEDEIPHKKPKGDCGCGKGMCKMCGKGMKKHMSESFDGYANAIIKSSPKVGTEEYRKSFFNSLRSSYVDPRTKYSSGLNLEEDVLLNPGEKEPQPGEPGFAPQSRIGAELPEKPAVADWEQSFTQVAEWLKERL